MPGAAEFARAAEEYLRPIDPADVYADAEAEFRAILDAEDYDLLLRRYNHKSLVKQVAHVLGLALTAYQQLVLRLLQADTASPLRLAGDKVRDAMKPWLPNILTE